MIRKKRWTRQEIEFLKQNYGETSTRELAGELNKTKCSLNLKANRLNIIFRRRGKTYEKIYGIEKSKETKMKIGLKSKERWLNLKYIKNISNKIRKKWQMEEYRKKAKRSMKEVWEDKKYKKRQVERLLHTHFSKPTQLEQRFDAFFKQNHIPFRYVGDGQLIISGKNPDFVCNPKKLVIEVGSKKEKAVKRENRSFINWQDYERQRKAHFKRWHFDCLCLWEDELRQNPQKLLRKIKTKLFRV
jgi:very-short-patch-repair endonuclease